VPACHGPALVEPIAVAALEVHMDINEVREWRQELEAVEARLRRVRDLWLECPTAEEVAELTREAAALTGNLKEAGESWQSPNLPTEDELAALTRESAALAGNLKEARAEEA
jgi:hypothetical protein